MNRGYENPELTLDKNRHFKVKMFLKVNKVKREKNSDLY